MRNIGEYLHRYRKRKGWTQEEMAKKLRISCGTYWKIEKGYTDFNLKRLEQIADVLDLTIPDILFEAESGKKCQSSTGFKSDENQMILELQNQLIEKEIELRRLKERSANLLQQLIDCHLGSLSK